MMTDVVTGGPIDQEAGDALVVPVLPDLIWGPGAAWAVEQLGEWVPGYLEGEGFSGKTGELATLPGGDTSYGSVVFVGVGDEIDAETLRRAAGKAGGAVSRQVRVVTTLHEVAVDGAAEYVTLGFLLGQYRFEKYLSDPKPVKTSELVLAGAEESEGSTDADVSRGRVLAEGVVLARDLVNEPAGAKAPAVLADIARTIADENGLEYVVFTEDDLIDERLGGLAAVAAGATNPPRLVILRYRPEAPVAKLVLVGKGIVFDSGGLSLKPPSSMETMKTDMSGAAAVFGAMQSIARLDLPVEVVGVTPLTENMPGGSAQRPGDVMRARNGKTIEVLNTDAEGRLVLADGLSIAVEEEPDLIVDIATLTGSCMVALGPKIAGLWSNDDEAAVAVEAAARTAGEKVWRMPLEQEYRSHIDSSVADMKNTAERWGGAIAAALLLEAFVDDRPWVHLDIAGPARASKAEHYVMKGGTGYGVRTMVEIAAGLAG
jgi:leucyl aminopeptidase